MPNVYPYYTLFLGAFRLVACEHGFGDDDDIIYGQPCELTSDPERFGPDVPLPRVVGHSGIGLSFFELTKDIPNSAEVSVRGFGDFAERGPRAGRVSFESA